MTFLLRIVSQLYFSLQDFIKIARLLLAAARIKIYIEGKLEHIFSYF